MLNKEEMLGYGVTTASAPAIVDEIIERMKGLDRKACWLACLNPHSYVVSLKDADFSRALRSSDFLVADGVGVVIAARLLGKKIYGRVTGSDIFFGLNAELNASGTSSAFFLGSTEECLSEIRRRFEKQYPRIRFAGSYSPPFESSWTELEVQRMRSAINATGADVLWVGMTAPKQEKWIAENLPFLKIRFVCAVGAVFDFYSGRVGRSSRVFQDLGLEWLPRLLRQPRRLWRRMFISAPIFLWHVAKDLFRHK